VTRGSTRDDGAAHSAPGKRTLVAAIEAAAPAGGDAVQRRGDAAAPGGETGAVQAAAARGTAGPAGPLPHLHDIQSLFGRHDVRGVRAYVGGSAAEGAAAMGAQAFATGDQVAFGAAPDLHTAAHEAAHVVQQRRGVQLKGGVGEAGDAHERHADAVADAVVRGESAEGLLEHLAPSAGTGGPAVQRKVTVAGANILGMAPVEQPVPYSLVRNYDEIVLRAIAALPEDIRPTKEELAGLMTELSTTLASWAESGTGGVTTVLKGQTAHDRVYAKYEDLGRALIGTVRSTANMRREQALAKEARTSATVLDGVAACMRLVHAQIDRDFEGEGEFAEFAKRMKTDLGKLRSRYWWWYMGANILNNLENPSRAALDKNVSILHDLEDYFRYENKWKKEAYGDWKKELRKGTIGENPDDRTSGTRTDGLGDYRTNWTSVKEDNAWIQTARSHDMPVWAGPSMTTGRMLTFLSKCGADTAQLSALAWGIWAFWNTSYYSGMSGIHTFHEVMDIAHGFGVAYTAFEYPAHALGVK
jgi:hypothetical protein